MRASQLSQGWLRCLLPLLTLTFAALSMPAVGDTLTAAQNILLQSGQDISSTKSSSHSSSGGIGVDVGAGGVGFQASGALAASNGTGTTADQVNTVVNAGNTLMLNSGGNTILAGAQGNAADIVANVGGNLDIISRQNTANETYAADSASASLQINSGIAGGSGNLSQTNINNNAASVGAGQQSGLVASNNLAVNVAGNTDLDGGILSAPVGTLNTGSLTAETIANSYKSSGSTIGIGLSSNGFMPSGVLPSGSSTSGSGAGTTFGTVAGNIVINAGAGGIPTNLNRDAANANGAVTDDFDLTKYQTRLETQQIGAQLFGQAANYAAGTLIKGQGWSEGSTQSLLLHGLIGVAQAAISGGGNVGTAISGGAGAVAGTALDQYLVKHVVSPDSSLGKLELSLAGDAIGAAAGVAGGGSDGAVAGASAAGYSEVYNRLLHPNEAKKLAALEAGQSPDAIAKLEAAECYLTQCAAGVPSSDVDYTMLMALQTAGAADTVQIQQIEAAGAFDGYTFPDQLSDYIFSQHDELLTRTIGAGQLGGASTTTAILGVGTVAFAIGCPETAGAGCALAVVGGVGTAQAYQTAQAGSQTLFGPYQSTEGQQVINSFGLGPNNGDAFSQLGAAGLGLASFGLPIVAGEMGVLGNGANAGDETVNASNEQIDTNTGGSGGSGSSVPPLFRGTSDGYPGNSGLQTAGVTPTTTNPAVATVFGTAAQQYGNGIVQIALPGDIAEVDIIPGGNASAGSLPALESETGVNMPPAQFANQASISITTQQAQTILQNMGLPVPGNIANQGTLSQILQTLPPMTQPQIQEFITQAQAISSATPK